MHHPKLAVSRTGVYAINMQNQKLLLVKQFEGIHIGKWDLPGGGIEPKETIEEALRREFFEEVGMRFDTMQLFGNFTAVTAGITKMGEPYDFHQIGLIYQVEGLSQLSGSTPELEYAWIDPEHLGPGAISPFVREVLALLEADAFRNR